jgi:enoyl-CoA hydratase
LTLIDRSYSTIVLECSASSQVLVVRLNRPGAANAVNTAMIVELENLFRALASGEYGYRCVVITGTGPRAFCGGGDLKERRGFTDADWTAQHRVMERAMLYLSDCPVPVLAAVNGAAIGGGLELVLASDIAYGVPDARFALPEVGLGIIPGAGGTQNLPRLVGPRRAKALILSGCAFTADEALAWGVLNKVVPAGMLMEEILGLASTIAGNAPLAVRQAKKAINYGLQMDLQTGMRLEIELYDQLVPTADRREGVCAFIEKRPPEFGGY